MDAHLTLFPAYDAVIIGGGFYGCSLALYLRAQGQRVVILERDSDLLLRASYANQARVHGGYHYPRSFVTAWRSLINFPRFVQDFTDCIDTGFEKVYAIANSGSKVSAYQFLKFCYNIGAPVRPAPGEITRLFNRQLIEQVYMVREYAFDAGKLRAKLRAQLHAASIPVQVGSDVVRVKSCGDGRLRVELENGSGVIGGRVFNCTYAGLNTILRRSGLPMLPLKHEVTEMALIDVPPALEKLGVTIMDGPFFSVMPFPAEGLHSLSHVRYTPHESWIDQQDGWRDPYAFLGERETHYPYMLRDAQRFLPALAESRYVKSLFEIKTVLVKNEDDDGRPILWREDYGLENLYVVMGGKIDNIYDALGRLELLAHVREAL